MEQIVGKPMLDGRSDLIFNLLDIKGGTDSRLW